MVDSADDEKKTLKLNKKMIYDKKYIFSQGFDLSLAYLEYTSSGAFSPFVTNLMIRP